MKALGVIPARGGSKGIPKKNLASLGGRSLLLRAIEAGRDSNVLHRLVVDSDDDEIIAAARACSGAEVLYCRPAELASDIASTASAVRYLLNYLMEQERYRPDCIVLLEPTCPLRTATDVANAYRAFVESGKPCGLTVCAPMQHPNDFVRKEGADWTYWTPRQTGIRGRQDFAEAWFINGGVYLTQTQFFLDTGKFYDLG